MKQSPYIHLAIDVQDGDIQYLHKRKRTLFKENARAFADDLRRRSIPTIWIMYRHAAPSDLHMPDMRVPRSQQELKLFKFFGFDHGLIMDDEAFFTKASISAFHFSCRKLTECLHANRALKGVLYSGMNTSRCVIETLIFANDLLEGVERVAVYDQMADSPSESAKPLPPQWHKDKLEHWHEVQSIPSPSYMTRKQVLNNFS